jgi:hypothetical protein
MDWDWAWFDHDSVTAAVRLGLAGPGLGFGGDGLIRDTVFAITFADIGPPRVFSEPVVYMMEYQARYCRLLSALRGVLRRFMTLRTIIGRLCLFGTRAFVHNGIRRGLRAVCAVHGKQTQTKLTP